MKEAGIPYFTCYATDVPAGEENNLYANCYDSSAAQVYSKVLVDWIINDSGGAANALVVNLPAFPILSAQAEGAKAEFETCTGCTVNSLDLTLEDLTSGGTPNAIISFLQSNPDVNYLYLTYSGFEPGLAEALESAGMADKVKIAGTQAQQPQMQAIIDGKERGVDRPAPGVRDVDPRRPDGTASPTASGAAPTSGPTPSRRSSSSTPPKPPRPWWSWTTAGQDRRASRTAFKALWGV